MQLPHSTLVMNAGPDRLMFGEVPTLCDQELPEEGNLQTCSAVLCDISMFHNPSLMRQ